MREQPIHLDEGSFQRYLEGELDDAVRAFAEAHLSTCERCAARLEGWRMLLEELEDLPELPPPHGFSDRILASIPSDGVPAPSHWTRARAAFRRLRIPAHPSDWVLQDLIDGAVVARKAARIQVHLAECDGCRHEYETWRMLSASLAALQRCTPSPGFAEAVMSRVELVADRAAEPSWSARLLSSLRLLIWSNQRAWGAAGALVVAPLLIVSALVGSILLHPLLSLGDLLVFGVWQATDFVQVSTSWFLSTAMDSTLVLGGYRLVQALISSPEIALSALAGVWTALVGVGWILYRNLLAPTLFASHHG